MSMSPAELTRHMSALREAGWVLCDWRARSHAGAVSFAELEAYVDATNLASLGKGGDLAPGSEGWREIAREEAQALVVHWMRFDLAYEHEARESTEPQASAAAAAFFDRFGDGAQLFTNGGESDGEPRAPTSWTSRTRHTFDLGVVAADAQTIGLVWFADED
ncbi:MAG TPA: hypothetical protein VIA18_11005 [Polyangia bacterium]|nr:hypothetical protein [Polyangia bacterium]